MKIGDIISEALSDAIKGSVSVEDMDLIARQYGRSGGSLRQIVYRQIPVTYGNAPMLHALMDLAIVKNDAKIQALTELKASLP